MIPGMHTDLEAAACDLLHFAAATTADVRAGEQHSVQQRLQAVVLEHRGALHLAEEPAAERAPDRPPGVIRSEAEEKGGVDAQPPEQIRETYRALAGAAVGVHIDLERDGIHQAWSAGSFGRPA